MTVAVVYASGSKTIRRIIVSDDDAVAKATLVPGEAVIEVPFDIYNKSNDADLRAYLAKAIGEPKQDTRCVEIDASGAVVAVYAADPEIDKPLLNASNVIELHADAVVGDQKVGGVFPVKQGLLTPEQQKAYDDHVARLAKFDAGSGKL